MLRSVSSIVAVVFLLSFTGQAAFADLQDGLIAWWRMEQRQGNEIPDASGHGHDLTVNGSPTFQGNIVVFNDDGTLETSDANDLDLLSDWSVSYWAREDSNDHSPPSPTNMWMSKMRAYADAGGGWCLNSSELDGVNATIYGTPNCNIRTPDRLTLGAWYRLTTTFESASNTLRIYFNHNVAIESQPACEHSMGNNEFVVLLGGNLEENETRRPFCKGAMADIRIYDRVLSEPEVAELVAETIAGNTGDVFPIPAVSAWGMLTMTLLVLTAGTLVFVWRRQVA